ncbi:UDP-glycosyltransferase 90A1 [Nicotiana tabacum]|uniref:Glycosyltransferase n=2 Tax=Nicotiana tabacum TaxID=4097 RepID=A0A1S3ZH41_TOBAC|nr:PREDICTED: UDP-glycosyltransferase 90A1-like [Nicotiana tabacum]WIW42717.1 UDP-glycosyltransferase [Nicotiana tabacum]
MASPPCIHVVLFPFMSKGHTIPIFDLARILLNRKIAITIFTTPANRPFFSKSLSNTNINIIDIPFPENIEGIPPGVESTDKLPSMSLFVTFANATKSMKPQFEQALESLPPVTFMVTDGFLGWTLDSANKFGIPRIAYYGMSAFSSAISHSAASVLHTEASDDEPFAVPNFPSIKLTRNDFDFPFREREPKGPIFEFTTEAIIATSKSYGLLVNSFYELESIYVDYCNRTSSPRKVCVGPFCAAVEPPKEQQEKPSYIKWLDEMLEQGKPVLYVAFGSQAELSPEQFKEIKIGLEKSEVNFFWVVRRSAISEPNEEFENRVKNRGLVVAEWVDQRQILSHGSVQGFLSHCGWNSVIESICAEVPILAWPMMAEQHLNARMVVEEIKIGLRVETCDGSVRGFVKWEGLEKPIRELMEGEKGKEAKKKVKEICEAAINAVKDGGTSWQALNELIHELSGRGQV